MRLSKRTLGKDVAKVMSHFIAYSGTHSMTEGIQSRALESGCSNKIQIDERTIHYLLPPRLVKATISYGKIQTGTRALAKMVAMR